MNKLGKEGKRGTGMGQRRETLSGGVKKLGKKGKQEKASAVGWREEAWEVGQARKRKGTTASVVGRSEEAWQRGEARKW
jgi:hypothetical protein